MMRSSKRLQTLSFGLSLALGGGLLTGCSHTWQIEVPAGFHGSVHITCVGLSPNRVAALHVTGEEMSADSCPEHQVGIVVTRVGDRTPADATTVWTTTGDGLVRGLVLDVK